MKDIMKQQNNKDWTGNDKAIFSCHGASNHSETERQSEDYYATPDIATELLCELETFNKNILEPACGEGAISKVLEKYGYNVESRDLIDRGYGQGGMDFLQYNDPIDKDIVTNVPYKIGAEFVKHAMDLLVDGHKAAFFLKLTFLEGEGRRELFKQYPPKKIYVSVSRIDCAKNGEFKLDKDGKQKHSGGAVCYAWFIFQKGFKGSPTLGWFN